MERRMLNLIIAVAVIVAAITYVWSVGSAKDKQADQVISVNVTPPRPDASDPGFGFSDDDGFTLTQP